VEIVVWVGCIGFVVVMTIVLTVRAKRRLERVTAWAASTGWQLQPEADELTSRWGGSPFGVGRARRAREVLTGTWQGHAATSFQYTYTTSDGKNTTTHTFHVLTLALPAALPALEFTPEGVGTRIASALGGQDLDFESEEFNRAWRVRSPFPRFASDVVHPRLMELLLRPGAQINLRIDGSDILTWTSGPQRLEAIAGRLALLDSVVASIPRFVWQNQGYDPMTPSSPEGEK